MFIVDNSSRLEISDEIASDDVDRVVVSGVINGIQEALLVGAECLDVDPLCTAITPDLWEDHGF